jgi:large subunit ribosomal protein L4e
MFAPTKTWRKWHRKTNTTMKRHAVASALAASGIPALVMARGHKINEVPELPLVVSSGIEELQKTSAAVKLLEGLGLGEELAAVRSSKRLRCGKGKNRNRRWSMKKGPLVVYAEDKGVTRAFRNIPGVDLASVDRLNLLELAPGGAFGRLVVFTQPAFKKLQAIYGSYKSGSAKKGYTIQRPMMLNADIARIINSNEVQSVLEPAKETVKGYRQNKNCLKNKSVLGRLCPAETKLQKMRQSAHKKGTKVQVHNEKMTAKKKAFIKKHKKTQQKWYADLIGAHAPVVEEQPGSEE